MFVDRKHRGTYGIRCKKHKILYLDGKPERRGGLESERKRERERERKREIREAIGEKGRR